MKNKNFTVVNGGLSDPLNEDRRVTYGEYAAEISDDKPYKSMYEVIKERANDRRYYGKYWDKYPEAVKGWNNRAVSNKYIMAALALEAYRDHEFDPIETKNCFYHIMSPYIEEKQVLCKEPEMESLEYAAIGYGYLACNKDTPRSIYAGLQQEYISMAEQILQISAKELLENHREERLSVFADLPQAVRKNLVEFNALLTEELSEVSKTDPSREIRNTAKEKIPAPEKEKKKDRGMDI